MRSIPPPARLRQMPSWLDTLHAQPLFQSHAILHAAIKACRDDELMIAVLAVKVAGGRVLSPGFEVNAFHTRAARHLFEPLQECAADTLPSARSTHRKQQQMRLVARVLHDAEGLERATFPDD